jgi:PAS domain S-box-containing protein
MTPEGILTFVSPSWTALLGHPTDEVIGRSYREFLHPDDISACMAAGATLVKTKERQTGIIYRVFHADGSIHVHVSNISPVLDEKGNVASYIGNARDITDMKRSENAIRESNRKLNLLNSITRHDLANQLTVVQGYTQLAMLRKPDPVITEFIAKIAAAAEVMQRQIEFTRNYQDLGVQAPAWHRVSDSVLAVKPENVALTCSCGDWEVFADPMIGKVFFNLFDNAIRHGVKVSAISVSCGMVSGELVITVEDNGVGIPLDEKQKIFGKGYGKNTGFGLFLVREILAITGIFIHETGAHGKGARFEIAVPKGAYRIGKKAE